MRVQLFITGRMYHLADDAPDALELPDDADLAIAIERMQGALPEPLPESTIISVSGRHAGAIGQFENTPLRDGDELMLVAPVAGG